jgi:hypothetical protein
MWGFQKIKICPLLSLEVTIFRYDVIFSPRYQCGEYSGAKLNVLNYTFIFRQQFYFSVSGLKIISHGNLDNNVGSYYVSKLPKYYKLKIFSTCRGQFMEMD